MIAILAPSPGGEKGPHLVLTNREARGVINTLNSTLVSASLAPHAKTLSSTTLSPAALFPHSMSNTPSSITILFKLDHAASAVSVGVASVLSVTQARDLAPFQPCCPLSRKRVSHPTLIMPPTRSPGHPEVSLSHQGRCHSPLTALLPQVLLSCHQPFTSVVPRPPAPALPGNQSGLQAERQNQKLGRGPSSLTTPHLPP